jgi:hypothetical protein
MRFCGQYIENNLLTLKKVYFSKAEESQAKYSKKEAICYTNVSIPVYVSACLLNKKVELFHHWNVHHFSENIS